MVSCASSVIVCRCAKVVSLHQGLDPIEVDSLYHCMRVPPVLAGKIHAKAEMEFGLVLSKFMGPNAGACAQVENAEPLICV